MLAPTSITRSPSLLWFAVFLHGGALLAIFICHIPFWIKFLLVPLWFYQTKNYFKEHVFLTSSRAVLEYALHSGGFWKLQFKGLGVVDAALQSNHVVTPFLTILHFLTENEIKKTLVLTPKSLGCAAYRRLLVHLHHDLELR